MLITLYGKVHSVFNQNFVSKLCRPEIYYIILCGTSHVSFIHGINFSSVKDLLRISNYNVHTGMNKLCHQKIM